MKGRNRMKSILIITAGGTIDAHEYNFETGSVISFAAPAAIDIIEKLRPDAASREVTYLSPFQKDSDVMTDSDRDELLSLCRRSKCDRIVITHGSGTILDTGRLLARELKDKTVVLTSALPYTFDPVYATFNLGAAISACQLQPPGVYVATNGEVIALDGREIGKVKSGKVTYFVEK